MSFLIDTNVLSEFRKGERADHGVKAWFSEVDDADLYLSVLVVGEVRLGIERLRKRDDPSAQALDGWLRRVTEGYHDRILPVTREIAETWGQFNAIASLPVLDSLLAATAHVHRLTLVTRDVGDIERTGVSVLDPFDPSGRRYP